jgi:hypothetical protein
MVLRDLEKRAAQWCQAWDFGEHIADIPHQPHSWWMDAIFSPVVASHMRLLRAMICFLLPLAAPLFPCVR